MISEPAWTRRCCRNSSRRFWMELLTGSTARSEGSIAKPGSRPTSNVCSALPGVSFSARRKD